MVSNDTTLILKEMNIYSVIQKFQYYIIHACRISLLLRKVPTAVQSR